MIKCPLCYSKKNKKITAYNYIPYLRYSKCYNCKRKYIWIQFLNKNFFLKKESLIK